MRRGSLNYYSNRAEQEQEAAKAAGCSTSRLAHLDLAARYRVRARTIELSGER